MDLITRKASINTYAMVREVMPVSHVSDIFVACGSLREKKGSKVNKKSIVLSRNEYE